MAAANDEVDVLRAEMAAMQERILMLTESANSTSKSEFKRDWWTPIRETRPDQYLQRLLTIDCDRNMTPASIWKINCTSKDRQSIFSKFPENIKTPKLSDES
jgi:hypothetical protein